MNSSMSPEQVRSALEQLLEKHDAYCLGDDLIVRESITRSGRKLYVIIATNGAEQPVKSELAAIAGSRACCGAGTWVLKQEEVSELVRTAIV